MVPDDFAPGAFCTVLSWTPYEVDALGFGGSTGTQVVHDRSFVGDVLRIEAVDLPFVVVTVLSDRILCGPRTIDTRRCTLKRLSEAFVQARLGGSDARS